MLRKEAIEEILSYYYNEYNRVFACFDFSGKADRFTEENQTVNFCRAVKEKYPEAVTWYEHPFAGENGTKRFDAVVYIKEINSLLIVEAKCLRKHSKYEAMYNDLERICKYKNQDISIFGAANPTVYAVILADHWYKTHGIYYTDLLRNWKQGCVDACRPEEKKFSDFMDKAAAEIMEPHWAVKDFSSQYKNYHLLTMIGKVR